MGAAVDLPLRFDAMADNSAIAVRAVRGHRMDRTLEAVKGHGLATLGDRESLVIGIAADIARCHRITP